MPELTLYQIDAFAGEVFQGNPAAVVPLETWLPDARLQQIALENNLSETAFFVPVEGGYHLRWFTPVHEVPLCGHATLASAYVIFTHLQPQLHTVRFETLSGRLGVSKQGNLLVLDFPALTLHPSEAPAALLAGLGAQPEQVFKTVEDKNYYAVYGTEPEIIALKPELARFEALYPAGVVVTAPGETSDFVSRYFAPAAGIPEDPVTGSIHCGLIPYWAERLGKTKLFARQVSKRGGELHCELLDRRVAIGGRAAQYLVGTIWV